MSSETHESLCRSPLHEEHIRLGAKMTGFGGFEMPLQYSGIREEHLAVRERCGLFDASHMGEIEVTGHLRKEFLNYLLTNDIDRIQPGQAQYTLMCDDDGGVIDDLFVMNLGDRYWLVVNASNTTTDLARVLEIAERFGKQRASSGEAQRVVESADDLVGLKVDDISSSVALLALQGPYAEAVLERVLQASVPHLPYFGFDILQFSDDRIVVSRTGYTGEDGFEIYLPAKLAPTLWRLLLETEVDGVSVSPCGLGARDSLRLEMGYSLYGHELSLEINPYEAGVGFAVKLDKGDFAGREALAGIKAAGVARRIVALKLTERGVPRSGDRVFVDGNDVGHVTSGGFSPVLAQGIALALVDAKAAELMKQAAPVEASVMQRQRKLAAQPVKLPFVPSHVKR